MVLWPRFSFMPSFTSCIPSWASVYVFLHLCVVDDSEYTCRTGSSHVRCVYAKQNAMICNLNFSMVTPVGLGLECCSYFMCLPHLLRMRTAVSWHALLFPVEAASGDFHKSYFCVLQVKLIVTTSQCSSFDLAEILNELVKLSSLVKERVIVWANVIAIVSWFPSMWVGCGFSMSPWWSGFCCVLCVRLFVKLLCVGLVVVFRGDVDVVCARCMLLFFHRRADRCVSMC